MRNVVPVRNQYLISPFLPPSLSHPLLPSLPPSFPHSLPLSPPPSLTPSFPHSLPLSPHKQSSYSCLCFQDVLWPEFSIWDFFSAMLHYQRNYAALQVYILELGPKLSGRYKYYCVCFCLFHRRQGESMRLRGRGGSTKRTLNVCWSKIPRHYPPRS